MKVLAAMKKTVAKFNNLKKMAEVLVFSSCDFLGCRYKGEKKLQNSVRGQKHHE